MAPIPEDNEEKPPHRDDGDLNAFSNAVNLTATANFDSDSSEENDDNYPDTTGYMLLPQEPGIGDDDTEDDTEHDNNIDAAANISGYYVMDEENDVSTDANDVISNSAILPDHLPDEVMESEGGAVAPTVAVSSTSLHPEFLAKFPDGKVPSYMQVPDIPSNSKDMLWNKKRPEKSSCLETEEKKIVTAMSGFSLPSENIPDWAKNMSEDQWHHVISQQITSTPSNPSSHFHSNYSQKKDMLPHVPSDQKSHDKPDEWIADFPDS